MTTFLLRRGPAFAALCSLLLLAGQALAKGPDNVRIDRLAGSVEVMHAQETKGKWQAAELKQELLPGWSLRTGKQSKAQLVFPKDNTVILRENSVLEILELRPGGGARLKATEGGLLAQLKHKLDPGAEFDLETPTALAVVRGTEYGVDIEETGQQTPDGQPETKTTFYGYEGKVEVTNELGQQLLEADKTLSVVKDVAPGLPLDSVSEALDFLEDLSSEKLFEQYEEKLKHEAEKKIRDKVKLPGGFHL